MLASRGTLIRRTETMSDTTAAAANPGNTTTAGASSASGATDYQLGRDVGLTLNDAVGTIAGFAAARTTFANPALFAQGDKAKGTLFATPPSISGQHTWPIGDAQLGAQIAIDASAQYQASAFIPSGAADPDGAVTAAPGHAWLKQEVDLALSFSGQESGLSFGPVAVSSGGSAAANVRLLDYRQLSLTEEVAVALRQAITDARFVFRDADVARLDANGCLALVAGGNLTLSATVSVSDALSASLNALDSLLGTSGALSFQVGASLEVTVGLADNFSLIFSRAASGRIAVAVHKTATSNLGATLGLGLKVGFADPDAVAPAVQAFIESRLGVAYQDYERLVQAICNGAAAALPQDLQTVADTVASTLGLPELATQLAALKGKVCGLDAKVATIIQDAVNATFSAQFTFAWSRTTQDDTVLAFEMDPASVPTYLGPLLLGNLAPVLRQLAARNPNLVLGNYLETKTVDTSRSFGVSLSLGKWSVSGGTSFTSEQQTQTKISQGKTLQRRSVDGRNEYKADWFGSQLDYFVDLSAAMPSFAASPTLADYLLGLRLSFTWQQAPSPSLAAQWSDLLETWQLPPAALNPKAAGTLDAAVDLTITDSGVRTLATIANRDPQSWRDAWAWALAAALPTIPNLNYRATLADRVAAYGEAGKYVLTQLQGGGAVETASVVGQVRYSKAERTRLLPIDAADPQNSGAAVYYLYGIGPLWQPESPTQNPWQLCERIRKTFAALAAAGGSDTAVDDALRALNFAVDGDPFTMRLLGALVVRLLSTVPQADTTLFTLSARSQLNGTVTLTASGR
jgi:hypothetical protein